MRGARPVKQRAYENLGEFMRALEDEGEVLRIRQEVSPILEIAEITDRASKAPGGGKALLFERVEGASMPVLTNAFGSMRRICMALGVEELDDLAGRLKAILTMAPPRTLGDKVRLLKEAVGWSRFLPRRSRRLAPCQERVLKGEEVDLTRLPVLQCWPRDAGRFITLPLVFSRGLSGQRNVGMYRLQLFDKRTLGMHWHLQKDGAYQFHEHGSAGRRMEVAVALGADPAVTYAAGAPLPYGADEMLLAGFVRGRPVRMARGVTVDVEVPAEAEIVIEGYVDPGEERLEGPFGDHTGFYSPAAMYPVLHVTAVTSRRDPVYGATVVGRPPMEDCYLATATERIFLPLLQAMLPELVDYRMPWEGVFHNCVLASIEKRYPGQAQRVMHGLWGSGQMGFCKAIFVLDAPIDLSKGAEVVRTLLDTIDLERDILLSRGMLDVLDHASSEPLVGGKIGVDATERRGGEGERVLPAGGRGPAAPDGRLASLLGRGDGRILECRTLFPEARHPVVLLRLGARGDMASLVEFLLASELLPAGSFAVLFDGHADIGDSPEALWRACANTDPAHDLYIRGQRVVIDATAKPERPGGRPWPAEIRMTGEMARQVTARAEDLGLEPGMAELDASRYE